MNRASYFMDVALLLAFLITAEPVVTGIPLHEWCGVVLLIALITMHNAGGLCAQYVRRNLPATTRKSYLVVVQKLLRFNLRL
jgi:hypothetical protein